MACAAEQQPPESVVPQKHASGAEIASLVAHDMQRDGAAPGPVVAPGEEVVNSETLASQYEHSSGPTSECLANNPSAVSSESALPVVATLVIDSKESKERGYRPVVEIRRVRLLPDRPACEAIALVVALGVACALLALLISYFKGCGACENDAACEGLFGECVCTDNHLGEFCEESCGDFGQVNGSSCVCSGNHTGAFCELDALGQIVDDVGGHNDSGLVRPGEIVEEQPLRQLVPSWLLTTCSVVVIVGCLAVGPGAYASGDVLGYILCYAPICCCAICVAMTVPAVVAFGGVQGLAMGAGLALVLAGLAVGNFFVGDYLGFLNGKGGKGMIMAW